MDTAAAPAMLSWMTSLADATRARTLRLVERHELTVAELCAILQAAAVDRQPPPQGAGRRRLGDARGPTAPAASTAWRSDGSIRRRAGCGPAARADRAHAGRRAGRPPPGARASPSAGRARRRSSRRAAGQWDRLRREMFGARFDLARARRAARRRAGRVGDLGCGTGQIAETLAPFVAQRGRGRELARDAEGGAPALDGARQRRRCGTASSRRCRSTTRRSTPRSSCLVLHHVADPPAVLRRGGARAAARRPPADRRHVRSTTAPSTASRWATSGSASRRAQIERVARRRRLRRRARAAAAGRRRRPRARRCSPPARAARRAATATRRPFAESHDERDDTTKEDADELDPQDAATRPRPRACRSR